MEVPNPGTRIVAAAIVYKGKTYSLPAPNRHHNVIWLIHDETGDTNIQGTQGFLTDTGKFVGRKQAKAIALKSEQITETEHDDLYSEDLW